MCATQLRRRLGAFARSRVTSAAQQQEQTGFYKKGSDKEAAARQILGCLYVSVWGYLALGYTAPELAAAFVHPRDPENTNWFLEGMEHAGRYILDPPRITQQPEYRDNDIHAMLMLASGDKDSLASAVGHAVAEMSGWAQPIAVEQGRVLRRCNDSIEAFGFRDNISNPTYFSQGDPEYTRPRTVLVTDRLGGHPDAYGSFLVYRKLEQNVKAFQEAEAAIAQRLELAEDDRERAGAMIVGRFRDGTPLTLQPKPGNPTNTFDYAADPQGARCPMHAHLRKVRPRPQTYERARIARRGIPYGPYDPAQGGPAPETGSGLLFMSFQADIQHQFGQIFPEWVNRVSFEKEGTGQDPILGHGSIPYRARQKWPKVWNEPEAYGQFQCGASPRLVTFKGGEFLFAPSLAWFRGL